MPTFQAGGGYDAISKFLMERELMNRQAMIDAFMKKKQEEESQRQAAELALRQQQEDRVSGEQTRRFTADEEQRRLDNERRTQQDDVAAGARRQTQNVAGVRQMAMEGVKSGAATPGVIQQMMYGETGETIPGEVLDPGGARRTTLEDDTRNHQQAIELERIRGDESRRTVAARDAVSDTVGTKPNPQGTTDTLALLDRFEQHPGTPKAYGVVNSRISGFSQDAQDAISVRDQLVAALTLPNLGVLKGPASDNDVRFMKQMSSRLTSPTISMNEVQAAIKETRAYLTRRQAEELGMGRTGTTPEPQGGGVQRWGRDQQGRPVRLQ